MSRVLSVHLLVSVALLAASAIAQPTAGPPGQGQADKFAPLLREGVATIDGYVFDAQGLPLAGATIDAVVYPAYDGKPPLPAPFAISDGNGYFSYQTPTFRGLERLLVRVRKYDGQGELTHVETLHLAEAIAGQPLRLPDSHLQPVNPPVFVQAAVGAVIQDGEVTLDIPANALAQDSWVSVTTLDDARFLRQPLPPLVSEDGTFVDIHGVFGEETLIPVTLWVPNQHNLPIGTRVPFGKVDHNTLEWTDLRDLSTPPNQDAALGTVVDVGGGETKIRVDFDHFCSICTGYCLPYPPYPIWTNDSGEGCDVADSCGNSLIRTHEGTLEEYVTLPGFTERGQTIGLSFGYSSAAAKPSVMLGATAQPPGAYEVEAAIFQFKIPGRMIEAVYEGSQGSDYNASYLWDGRDSQGNLFPTGSYSLEARATVQVFNVQVATPDRFGGAFLNTYQGYYQNQSLFDAGGQPPFDRARSHVLLLNGVDSPYGAGWFFMGEQYLYTQARWDQTAEVPVLDATIVSGTGQQERFTGDPDESFGTKFDSPPGDFTTLRHDPVNGHFVRETLEGVQQIFRFVRGGVFRLEETVDRYGRSIRHEYADDLLVRVTTPMGNYWDFQYDNNGQFLGVLDSTGRGTQFTIDVAGDLTQVTDVTGATRTFLYDAEHLLIEQSGPRGDRSEYDYDGTLRRRVVAARAYDTDGTTLLRERLFAPTVLDGEIAEAAQNNQGTPENPLPIVAERRSFMVDGRGVPTEYDRNRGGVSSAMRDGLLRQTELTRVTETDPRIQEVRRPNGWRSGVRYDLNGNVDRVWEYDAFGLIYSETQIEYEGPFNQVSRVLDPKLKETTLSYDALGNVVATSDHLLNTTAIAYEDALFPEQPTRITSPAPDADEVTMTYDPVTGNVASITDYPDPTTNPNGRTTYFEYDAAGNLTRVTDPMGSVTRYAYDAWNRVIQVTNALNEPPTLYSYNDLGCGCSSSNLSQVTFANGSTIQYRYDGLNRMIERIDQLGASSYFQYDAEGHLIQSTNRNGEVITYDYDDAGQLLRKTLPGNDVTIYEYDEAGRLIETEDSDCRLRFEYDLYGRLTAEITTIDIPLPGGFSQPIDHRIDYAYDKIGNRLTMADSVGMFTYQYDDLHRLELLTNPFGDVWQFFYDNLSRRVTMLATPSGQPSGILTTYNYDHASQLERIQVNTTPPIDLQYETYNDRGQLTRAVENVAGTSLTKTYAYDALGRLKEAEFSQLFGDAQVDRNFVYDPLGSNRLLSDDLYTYSYDSEGQQTSRAEVGSSVVDHYDYDADGQMIGHRQTADVNGSQMTALEAEYCYDPLGRRIAKTVNGVTERYVYDGNGIRHFYGPKGEIEETQTSGSRLDERLSRRSESSTAFVSSDYRLNSLSFANETGNETSSFEFGETGETIAQAGNRLFGFGWSGRETDYESGLIFHRARHYSPDTGRFQSEDPIGVSGGLNLFEYGAGDPVNSSDPFGLAPSAMAWIEDAAHILTNYNGTYIPTSLRSRVYTGSLYEIHGGSACERKYVTGELNRIFATRRGSELADKIIQRLQPVRINIHRNTRDWSSPGVNSWAINIDIKNVITLPMNTGLVFASMTRIIAHELGHAVGGTSDWGTPNAMGNVIAWENPIMRQLGEQHYRVSYAINSPPQFQPFFLLCGVK